MCQYCDDNGIMMMDQANIFKVSLNRNPCYAREGNKNYLCINLDVDVGEFGYKFYETKIKISYCPYCGRKLEDNNV